MFQDPPVHFPIRYARLFAPKNPLPPIFLVRFGKRQLVIFPAPLRRDPDSDPFPAEALRTLVQRFQSFGRVSLCTGKALFVYFERAEIVLMRIGIEIKGYVPAVVEYKIEIATLFYGVFRHAAFPEHSMFVHLVARTVRALIARKLGAHGGALFTLIRRNKILC